MKKIIALLLAVLMLLSLAACADGDKNSDKDDKGTSDNANSSDGSADGADSMTPSGETVMIGLQPTEFCYPVIYAIEKGYFEDEGLAVDYIIFENGAAMNEGLSAGQLDIGVNGLATVYTVTSGVCKLIGESDTVATGAIYARPDSDIVSAKEKDGMLGSTETLTGKTVLGNASTLTQQQAYAYMDQFGLKAGTDYEFLSMDYSTANQAFIAGEGDIISVDGLNYITELEEAGMVKICDYKTATGSAYCSGLVARTDVCNDPGRAGDITLFLKVFYKAAEELMNDKESFYEGYLDWVVENGRNYTLESAKKEIEARPLFTAEDMASPDYVMGTSTINASEFFCEIGVIEEANLKNLANFDASFLDNALGLDVKVAVYE